jgi:hypothetical protein
LAVSILVTLNSPLMTILDRWRWAYISRAVGGWGRCSPTTPPHGLTTQPHASLVYTAHAYQEEQDIIGRIVFHYYSMVI